MLPAFTLTDTGGVARSFPSGRPALLCFVHEECATCDLSLPLIEAAHRAFGGAVDVWAIGQDADGDAARASPVPVRAALPSIGPVVIPPSTGRRIGGAMWSSAVSTASSSGGRWRPGSTSAPPTTAPWWSSPCMLWLAHDDAPSMPSAWDGSPASAEGGMPVRVFIQMEPLWAAEASDSLALSNSRQPRKGGKAADLVTDSCGIDDIETNTVSGRP